MRPSVAVHSFLLSRRNPVHDGSYFGVYRYVMHVGAVGLFFLVGRGLWLAPVFKRRRRWKDTRS